MNQFEAFKHYQEQQRQEQAAREQRLSEEQARKKKEVEHQQLLREQARRDAELKQATLHQSAERQAQEAQQHKEAERSMLLAQSAETLRVANQRAQEAQQIAAQKSQEQQAQKSQTWVGWDGTTFRSPSERAFWDTWKERGRWDDLPLVPQHHIGPYWTDFADPISLTVIEIDGRGFHTDRYTFTKDRVRERYLEKQGWHVIRFSHDEIAFDVEGRVDEAYEIIRDRRSKAR